MKGLKKHEGLPPWLDEPTSEGTARFLSERAVQIMRQHMRIRNFHPINSKSEKATLFTKQAACEDKPVSVWETCFPKQRQAQDSFAEACAAGQDGALSTSQMQ